MEKKITKLILSKLGTNPVCSLCNKPVTIKDQTNFEFVKTKRGEYHFYHGKCIDKYFGKLVDTKQKKEVI